MKTPKIAYLVNTYPRPSHSFIRREIAALEDMGFHVDRFAMRGDFAALSDPRDLTEHDKTEHILEAKKSQLLRDFMARARTKPKQAAAALGMARKRAQAGESSLSRQMIYLVEGAAIAARAAEKGISHIHAHFGTNSTRVAAYARLLGGPKFSFTVHGPEEFDRPVELDLGGKLALSEFAVTVSSYGRSQLCRWAEPGDWPKIKVVHCGIDLATWPAPETLPGGPFQMVAVGRFAEQKGFGLLIDAFAEARRRNHDLRLALVGDGPLRPQIEARIRSGGLGGAVDLLGWQDEAGVRRAMNAAHALVVPSFAEGLPVVIMEAMANARPVIATYIAGIPELVRPGQDGWLVPAGSTSALAGAMVTAAETPRDGLVGMGVSARDQVMRLHDINRSAEMLAKLFLESSIGGEDRKPSPA